MGEIGYPQRFEMEEWGLVIWWWKEYLDLSELLAAKTNTFKPFSPQKLFLDSTVSEMVKNDNKWKEDLIQRSFMEEDIKQILNIPLPRVPSPDQPLWLFDKKGVCSVKSGIKWL